MSRAVVSATPGPSSGARARRAAASSAKSAMSGPAARIAAARRAGAAPSTKSSARSDSAAAVPRSTAASRAPACLHQPYAHFADDASRKAEARLAGARLCVRVCVDPQVLARAAAADKKKDQEVETSRCTTFHLLPLAALQASKADIKRVFRSKAEVSALLNGTQAGGFPDDASLPAS